MYCCVACLYFVAHCFTNKIRFSFSSMAIYTGILLSHCCQVNNHCSILFYICPEKDNSLVVKTLAITFYKNFRLVLVKYIYYIFSAHACTYNHVDVSKTKLTPPVTPLIYMKHGLLYGMHYKCI